MSIRIEHIAKRYGRQQVLKDISLDIEEGTCVGITGRNGCGKTTMISIVTGVERPDSGSILYPRRGFSVGYLPQISPLLEDMSVYDNLRLWADKKDNIATISRQYELTDIWKKRVSRLSGGMKRRLAIACALINSPDLLVMDEPTAALDIEYKELIHNSMRSFLREGGTILMVTHEKDEMDMCDSCYLMDGGTLQIKP